MELNKLKEEVHVELNRENSYEEMLKFYEKGGTASRKVRISFKDELGVGDGVTRDAYAEFFESFYGKLEGESERVVTNTMGDDELSCVGKVISHAYNLVCSKQVWQKHRLSIPFLVILKTKTFVYNF